MKKIQIIYPLALLFLVLLFAMPRNSKLNYQYKVGQPWKYETLIAPFDFPIFKTEAQIVEELQRNSTPAVPYYKFSAEIENTNLRTASEIDLRGSESIRITMVDRLSSVYEKGIVGDEGVVAVNGSEPSDIVYVQRSKRASTKPVSEIYTISQARLALLASIAKVYPDVNVDSVLRANGIYDLVAPNLVYDRATSELIQAESTKIISPTQGYISAGQIIVSHDEIVTAEVAQMLDSYTKEYQNSINYGNRAPFLFWLGNGIIALGLVLLIFLAINFSNPELFEQKRLYIYLVLVIGIFMLAAILVPRVQSGLIYLVPFALCALLLEPYFDNRLIYMVYSISLLPLLLFSESPAVIYPVFLMGGVTSIYTFRRFNKGWLQFVNALISYAVMMLVYIGLRLIDVSDGGMLRISVYLFGAAMLPVAGFPLTYLFERIFNLVSAYRLAELADTSSSLIQELEKQAPGSFQHSLQVMNMADTVARAIGADILLVRVGALYHDIGKVQNALCFVENESTGIGADVSHRYHSALTPLQSASDIIRHVQDGIEMAERHHLPKVVIDFIRTHHGTTHTGYFYNKFLNEGGDKAQQSEFQYPGPTPRTREQVILMLCDSIEAASRTLKDYSPQTFDSFVERIVAGKIEEGQLVDAEITVKDLVKVKAVIKSYLSQMYHERIEYPKRKNNK